MHPSDPIAMRLFELLDRAVTAWLQKVSEPDLLGSWRGDGDLIDFAKQFPNQQVQNTANAVPNCIVLVEFARWARSTGSDSAIQHAKDKCVEILDKRQPTTDRDRLVHAITHTTMSVLLFDDFSKRSKAREHLGHAAKLYDEAWTLSKVFLGQAPTVKSSGLGPNLTEPSSAASLLDHAANHGAFGTQGVTGPTWQTLLALLTRLLNHQPLQQMHRNTPKALLITDRFNGQVLPFNLDKVELPIASTLPCYLDPLSFGITEFNPSLLTSLKLAARCAKHAKGHGEKDSIRIACDLSNKLIESLTGGSVGGLLAAAMIATMNQQQIDSQKSTTCRIWPRDDKKHLLDDEHATLTENDLVLKPIRGTVNKLKEAWQVSHGLNEFFLVGENFEEWNKSHPNCEHPKVTRVQSLSELIDRLMGPFAFEREIERHALAIHEIWEAAIQWKEGDLDSDASKLYEHGFRFYVAPNLRIEGPLRKKLEPHTDPSAVQNTEREETPVPSDGQPDSVLLNLLALSMRGECWPNAPDWLKGHKQLVIYDIAGAGKSVCSHRICHVLTNPNNWQRLFGNKVPPLVIRMEGKWPREFGDTGRLLSLRETIGRIFAEETKLTDTNLIYGVVDHALQQRRVCIIPDGIDQMFQEERDHMVRIYNSDDDARQCNWIGLSRVHTIDEYRTSQGIFSDRHWQRVRINPFTPEQQDAYFAIPDAQGRVIGQRWLETLADRQAMSELLGLPMVLAMIRLLIDEADKEAAEKGIGVAAVLSVFSTVSELYVVTTRKLLARALEKNSQKVEDQLLSRSIAIPPFRNDGKKLALLEQVLSLIAFQMMLMKNYNGSVQGQDPVDRLLKLSEYRFTKELRDRFEKADSFDQRKILKESEAADDQWRWAIEVLRTIELSHRSVVEAHTQDRIVFRSRKMLECHTARYLSRYATQWDIFATDDANDMPTVNPSDPNQDLSTLCAWNHTTDPQWDDAWRLAIDMPQEPIATTNPDGVYVDAVIDPLVTCRSLSALFRQPKAYDARDIRPTRLMYLAWHWFEFDDSLVKRRRFLIDGKLQLGRSLTPEQRKQFGERILLGGVSGASAVKIAREQVVELFRDDKSRQMMKEFEDRFDTILVDGQRIPIPFDPNERRAALLKWQQASSWEKSRTLLQCPPQSWIDAYEQAKSGGDMSIQDPRMNSAIKGFKKHDPFRIAATTVTREMYRQFDPAFENSNVLDWYDTPIRVQILRKASRFDEFDNDEHFPILCTNWFDAWAFCKWLGPNVGLAEDAPWELACRGGTQTQFHFGNVLDGTLANCDGHQPYRKCINVLEYLEEIPKGPFLGRTTPVGCDRYPCNPWGLFDVHGNCREWCDDGPNDGWAPKDQTLADRYSLGGSWAIDAEFSSSGKKMDSPPFRRFHDQGFRCSLP
jgi:hypothetical protein